jgi:hypothetical protein
LVTYRGVLAVVRRILDWYLCIIAILDLLSQPPQFNSIDTYWFEYRFIDEYFVVNQYESFKGILEQRYFNFSALLRSHFFHMVHRLAVKNSVYYIKP